MRSIFSVTFLCLAVVFHAWAQDLEAGIKAFNRGDYKGAVAQWRPLAEKGDRRAQHRLGLMYAQGLGVPRDPAEAAAWFFKAARQGHVASAYNLGFRYLKGEGVAKDLGTAALWFRRAAGAGHVGAQHTLGLLLVNGDGVERDYVQAYLWLSLSAKQKNRVAARDLQALIAHMTPAQVAEGEALVKKWQPDSLR
ncbi:MAG: tetratricopeptide repeat protein [Alphaproteobacteria bacterium]|nr:tetratricopeptide repeat protein [Alphaproteobacteria bacterium]